MMDDDKTLNPGFIDSFERAWPSDDPPNIKDFLPASDADGYLGTLQELVIIDLEFRWKGCSAVDLTSGKVPEPIESYIDRFPLLGDESFLPRLVEEEFVIRHRYGDRPTPAMFVARFPQFADLIQKLAADHSAEAPQHIASGSPQRRQTPVIENYSLVKEIGEGGMGSVYLAQQEQPVRRKVAVKVIRSGLDSKEVIVRFEAERQALAMMDHQNIARVFDAGTTQQGQPFFAMEHVDGIPITDYCQAKKTSIPDRLKLFNDVCAAVQHAHQKGILHRDLKPSNVLIAEEDGHPIAKVIDFGLAKAIDNSDLLTDKTLQTHVGQVLGTLKYMSPEQAATQESDVDTRADVYALGVMLYELLTGETPLDESAMRDQGILTILELIRDHEPVRPSVKLDAANHESHGISTERSTTSRALRQLLAGDLDWIVMKALEKDRDRRYDSASSLADDVRRFLNDEPVTARPADAIDKLLKTSPLAIESMIGVARSRITPPHRSPELAISDARQAMQAAENLLGPTHRTTLDARIVLATAHRFAGQYEESIKLFREVLATSDSDFNTSSLDAIDVALELGETLGNSGDWQQAVETTLAAVNDLDERLGKPHPRTLDARCQLADCFLRTGQHAEAETEFDSVRTESTKNHQAYDRAIRGLAVIALQENRVDSALDLYGDSLEGLAWVHIVTGQPEAAAKAYLKLREQLADQFSQEEVHKRVLNLLQWANNHEHSKAELARYDAVTGSNKSTLILANSFSGGILDVPLDLVRARQAILNKDSDQARSIVEKLMDQQLSDTQRALAELLFVQLDTIQGIAGQADKVLAIRAFGVLKEKMQDLPAEKRWAVQAACELIAEICEAEGSADEAQKWRARLSELESQRVQVTLRDSWDSTLSKPGTGLGAVPAE